MKKEVKHPLLEFDENVKISYLCIIASLCYIDKDFSDEEKEQLNKLLDVLEISDKGKSKIYSAIFEFNNNNKIANINIINNLKKSDIKFTLISDLVLIAFADDILKDEEYSYIYDIATQINVTKEQLDTIIEVQKNLKKLDKLPTKSDVAKKIVQESASKLAGAGISVVAIAASGSVIGLSGAGIASGLAALGALVGGGMLAGAVLVVPAIAIGTGFAIKKLVDAIWKTKKDENGK